MVEGMLPFNDILFVAEFVIAIIIAAIPLAIVYYVTDISPI